VNSSYGWAISEVHSELLKELEDDFKDNGWYKYSGKIELCKWNLILGTWSSTKIHLTW
jgi:hypothetical protein